MRNMSFLIALAALLALPALSSAAAPDHAGPPESVPPEHAKGESEAPGSDRAQANRERVLIVKACHAERGQTAATVAAFRAEYGTNPNGANAFGRCVSTRMHEGAPQDAEGMRELITEIRQRKSAARSCAAELRESGRADFAERYGSNRNLRNAFGRCVSSTVRETNGD